jgi:hypothetical protein
VKKGRNRNRSYQEVIAIVSAMVNSALGVVVQGTE